jgi:6-phosphogluconolactonase
MHRREFLKVAALTPMAFHLGQMRAAVRDEKIAYLGTPQALHVFTMRRGRWALLQEIACEAPSCLALHPSMPVLYATNEVREFQGFPTGSVTAFEVGADGHLTQIQRTKLSLSATLPRSIAISPDGTYALITAHGGGSYNLFSINHDGALGYIRGVVKEIGSSLHPEYQETSHPQHACFDGKGHILATDLGTDRIHVLSLADGSLRLQGRHQVAPGAGPAKVTVHPAGAFIAISNSLNNSVCVYRYDSLLGIVGERVVALPGHAMVLHSERSMLIVGTGKSLDLYRWQSNTGQLRLLHSVDVRGTVTAMHAGQGSILLASGKEVVRMSLDDLSMECAPLNQPVHCLLSA